MIELVVIGITIVAVFFFAVSFGKAKTEALTAESEAADAENANDILTRSVTRPDERVHKLDDAGYRD